MVDDLAQSVIVGQLLGIVHKVGNGEVRVLRFQFSQLLVEMCFELLVVLV
jgi:hypothetical protein